MLVRKSGSGKREESPVVLPVPDENPYLHVDRETHESGGHAISELGAENEIQELGSGN